jgi:hypothetical protein
MIVSDNPWGSITFPMNAYGGAADGVLMRLHEACYPGHGDCDFKLGLWQLRGRPRRLAQTRTAAAHARESSVPQSCTQISTLLVFFEVGDLPVGAITLEHVECAMRGLKAGLSAASRRHYAQLIARCLSPVYSSAFSAREGLRAREAVALRIRDLDLKRGAITLDENKTDDPRVWALNPAVRRALKIWADQFRGAEDEDALLFVDEHGAAIEVDGLAAKYVASSKTWRSSSAASSLNARRPASGFGCMTCEERSSPTP